MFEFMKKLLVAMASGTGRNGHYPMVALIKRCDGSCNIIDEPFSKVFVVNKSEKVMINMLNKNKIMSN